MLQTNNDFFENNIELAIQTTEDKIGRKATGAEINLIRNTTFQCLHVLTIHKNVLKNYVMSIYIEEIFRKLKEPAALSYGVTSAVFTMIIQDAAQKNNHQLIEDYFDFNEIKVIKEIPSSPSSYKEQISVLEELSSYQVVRTATEIALNKIISKADSVYIKKHSEFEKNKIFRLYESYSTGNSNKLHLIVRSKFISELPVNSKISEEQAVREFETHPYLKVKNDFNKSQAEHGADAAKGCLQLIIMFAILFGGAYIFIKFMSQNSSTSRNEPTSYRQSQE